MPVTGRLCNPFIGLLRSSNVWPSAFQVDHFQAFRDSCRFYSRKANAAKRAKKAELRALEKAGKRFVKTVKLVRPYPVDDCTDKEPSTDNVWFKHLHPFKQITFEEAVKFHRETVHETVYNKPGAFVNVVAVLNLETKKQNVTLDKIKGSYIPVHIYPAETELRVLALCKTKEDIEDAFEAGAASAGGLELIKSIEEGNLLVEEFDIVVAHTDVLINLAPIRGLMKTKMPKANQGTLGRDVGALVTRVKESRSYHLFCDNENKKIGWVDDTIGKLNMPDEHLKENLFAYLKGILDQQPRIETAPFVQELFVRVPSSEEVFLLSRETLLKEELRDVATNKKELVQSLISEGQKLSDAK